jgi:alkanesulfonate monooxygenase SsuD/methylene tetrahydromethanopterin reductase-like flavin-dependent oxidoreductase (luciferase family)
MSLPRVHLRVPHHLTNGPADRLAAFVHDVEDAGIDGVTVGDHVSFHDGTGYDGLVQATALAASSQRLEIWTAVYLLALRHPVTVARQVASLAALSPGRFVFGVGLGGDDRHELEVCGVDPRRRGRRLDTCLDVVLPLLRGDTVTSVDPELPIPGARIRPTPEPPVPVIVGGRSDAALRRAGRFGDGWLALWCTAERVVHGVELVEDAAREHGREHVARRYGYTVWCGLDNDRERARELVASAMEALYRQPFDSFARYTPAGDACEVAEALVPYVDAGVRDIVVVGVAADDAALVGHTSELADVLRERYPGVSG